MTKYYNQYKMFYNHYNYHYGGDCQESMGILVGGRYGSNSSSSSIAAMITVAYLEAMA